MSGFLLSVVLVTLLFECDIQVGATVVLSELMYHARQGDAYEYLELHNTDTVSPVDIGNWNFTDGIHYKFPEGTTIPPDGYIIVANNRTSFLWAYPHVPPSSVYGDLEGKFNNDGEWIGLEDDVGTVIFRFMYDDEEGWQESADGIGSSLEIFCDTALPDDPNSWRASNVPADQELFLEWGGSPGKRGNWYHCPALPVPPHPKIYFNEIMYNPVFETTFEDIHEFIEFFNDETVAVDISGWRVVTGHRYSPIRYTFPLNTLVQPKSFFILAKDRNALRSIYTNIPSSVQVFGGYAGELSNGGEKVVLLDSNGQTVEAVNYDDAFPWPIAADAFGAQQAFLSVNKSLHQFKGMSLERVNFNSTAKKRYNWVAAFPSPGFVNSAAKEVPDPCVTLLTLTQLGVETETFFEDRSTTVKIEIGPKNVATTVKIEYFIDDIHVTNEPHLEGEMLYDNTLQLYYYIIPQQPANSIVRFRFKASFGTQTDVVISPRNNDPFQWHGYHVTPRIFTSTPIYHMYITSENWGRMWTNLRVDTPHKGVYLDDNKNSCCILNPTYNDEVPAILAYKGRIYDVTTRYQGSPYNRHHGENITNWAYEGPDAGPTPVMVLSWAITVPRWADVEGHSEIILNKMWDGCVFFASPLIYETQRMLGIPATSVRFARLHINGGYYGYMMDVTKPSDEQISDYIQDFYHTNCRHQATEKVGILYKSRGYGCWGPRSSGSERWLWDTCGYTAYQRTQITYPIQTYEDTATIDPLYNLIDILDGPNSLNWGNDSVEGRAYFNDNFDVNMMLNYIASINWAGAWDDFIHNHLVYRRITDDRWTMLPWDCDRFWGDEQPCFRPNWTCTLYLGEEGAEVGQYQQPGAHNRLKDRFIKAFRTELLQRFRLLANSVLRPNVTISIMRKYQAMLNQTEINQAPTRIHSVSTCVSEIEEWVAGRYEHVLASTPAATGTIDVCPNKPTLTKVYDQYQNTPGRPYPPEASNITSNSVTLTWFAPNTNRATITSYQLQRNGQVVYSGNLLTFTDTTVTPVTQYSYTLQAVSSIFGASIVSQPTIVLTEMATPATTGATTAVGTTGTTGVMTTGVATTAVPLTSTTSTSELPTSDAHRSAINFITIIFLFIASLM